MPGTTQCQNTTVESRQKKAPRYSMGAKCKGPGWTGVVYCLNTYDISNYDKQSTFRKSASASFGGSQRNMGASGKGPGPGQYGSPNCDTQYTQQPRFGFGTEERKSGLAKAGAPAPNRYDVAGKTDNLLTRSPAYVMGWKPKTSSIEASANRAPAPGHYGIPNSNAILPRYASASFGGTVRPGIQTRGLAPGPGAYNVASKLFGQLGRSSERNAASYTLLGKGKTGLKGGGTSESCGIMYTTFS